MRGGGKGGYSLWKIFPFLGKGFVWKQSSIFKNN